MASVTSLTRNDTTVLSMIFDPENTTSEIEPSQPVEQPRSVQSHDLERKESSVIESISKDDVSDSSILKAITAFDEILKADPECASAYNNRAQARRMLHNINELHAHPSDVKLIMQDLDSAIQWACTGQTKVLAAAYTHRGYLYLRCAKDADFRAVVASLGGSISDEPSFWEEIASRDFAMGGKFGNPLAKRMAVHTNPYAKLCGEMVKQAMYAEMSGSAVGA